MSCGCLISISERLAELHQFGHGSDDLLQAYAFELDRHHFIPAIDLAFKDCAFAPRIMTDLVQRMELQILICFWFGFGCR